VEYSSDSDTVEHGLAEGPRGGNGDGQGDSTRERNGGGRRDGDGGGQRELSGGGPRGGDGQNNSEGDGEINLVVMLGAGAEVEVRLPGRYKVTPQIARAIKAVPGIVDVQAE
jgi:hypothetical protein